jgi:hypothetical protein
VPGYVHYDLDHPPLPGSPAVAFSTCEFRGLKVMCGPRGVKGEPDHLFHNNGRRHLHRCERKGGCRRCQPTLPSLLTSANTESPGSRVQPSSLPTREERTISWARAILISVISRMQDRRRKRRSVRTPTIVPIITCWLGSISVPETQRGGQGTVPRHRAVDSFEKRRFERHDPWSPLARSRRKRSRARVGCWGLDRLRRDLPREAQKGKTLPRQDELNSRGTPLHGCPRRRLQQFELARALQSLVLAFRE